MAMESKYPLLTLDMHGRYRIFEEENKFIQFNSKESFEEYIEKNKEKINIKIEGL